MEFNIGDKVKVKDYDNMPLELRNKRYGLIAGKEGVVVDKLQSEAKGCTVYKVHLDGFDRESKCELSEGFLNLIEEATYTYELEFEEKLAIARLYKVVNGKKTEVAKAHGHIFHEGVYGIAQAASYALKRICENLDGGSLRKYVKD